MFVGIVAAYMEDLPGESKKLMSDSVIIQNKSYLQCGDARLNEGSVGEYRREED